MKGGGGGPTVPIIPCIIHPPKTCRSGNQHANETHPLHREELTVACSFYIHSWQHTGSQEQKMSCPISCESWSLQPEDVDTDVFCWPRMVQCDMSEFHRLSRTGGWGGEEKGRLEDRGGNITFVDDCTCNTTLFFAFLIVFKTLKHTILEAKKGRLPVPDAVRCQKHAGPSLNLLIQESCTW